MDSLVSIIIATYNSSPFVVETLESIAKQTWEKLELIITDDCSGDNTVELCQAWLKSNRERFIYTQILTFERNTGVAANANRGLYVAKGKWIKFLAADDTLKPNCIEDNILWTISHPEVKVLFSKIEVYRDTFELHNLLETIPGIPDDPKSVLASGRSIDSQYRMLLLNDRIHFTPSVFINKEILLSVGGYDERFKMIEDYPLWLKLLRNGHRLYFMDKVTVNYRQHSNAANNTGIDYLISPGYFKLENFRKSYTYPYMPIDVRLNQRYYWYVSQIFQSSRLNRNNIFIRFFHSLFTTYLNPFKYYIYIKKRFIKNPELSDFYN